MSIPPILINGQRPGCISKQRAIDYLDGETKLVERMLWCARNRPRDPWVIIVRNRAGRPGQAVKIDTASFERAYRRLLRGEEPPLLPTEVHSKRNNFRDNKPENSRSVKRADGSGEISGAKPK